MVCPWQGHGSFEAVALCVGLPCFALMGYCILSAYGIFFYTPKIDDSSRIGASAMKSTYGFLLDVSDVNIDVDRVVDRWVRRGVFASILFALALVALAVTTVLHLNAKVELTFGLDALEAMLMLVCKMTVGICAHHVHRHLSRIARAVAASWVFVFAISNDIMAGVSLMLSLVYVSVEFGDAATTREGMCTIGYYFCWSLLLAMILQSVSAFALFRIRERAAIFVGDQHVFSRVVGNHWSVLVLSTFGVGVGLWFCAALFISTSHSLNPFEWMGILYLIAAFFQALAATSLLSINGAVKTYFNSSEGKDAFARVIEMGQVMDAESIGLGGIDS